MSSDSPPFVVPPRRPAHGSKLSLSIPSPLSLGHTVKTPSADPESASSIESSSNNSVPLPFIPKTASSGRPRRKPVLDFTQIDGARSHGTGQGGGNSKVPDLRKVSEGPNVASVTQQMAQAALSPGPGSGSGPITEANAGTNAGTNAETKAISETRANAEANADPEAPLERLSPEQWNVLANTNQIVELQRLGEGNGGSVSKCTLKNGRAVFALKLIVADPNPDIQKQIIRELQYNRSCHSPHIVQYYGTFMVEHQSMIGIAMEYMGGGTLDAIYKRVLYLDPTNRVSEKVLGKVAESVLQGLSYLHQQKIIHRDIKPSNILFDTEGHVKLCDFGVSGEVVNSLATTFVGTQYYMAPERIMGQPYTVSCDVWSLGVTLLEVAQGKFPFHSQNSNPLGPIELLSLVLEAEPRLEDVPEEQIVWTDSFRSFLGYCLRKAPEERPGPQEILRHPWCEGQRRYSVNMARFVRKVWG